MRRDYLQSYHHHPNAPKEALTSKNKANEQEEQQQ
jgi:hypothetical protein